MLVQLSHLYECRAVQGQTALPVGVAPHSSCDACLAEPTCQEGLQRLQQLCAGTAAALGFVLLELGGQQQAPPAAGVAEDLPTQAAVVPRPPQGPASRVPAVRQCSMLQQAGPWTAMRDAAAGRALDDRQWRTERQHLAEHLPSQNFTRPGQIPETLPDVTGKAGILAPSDDSPKFCCRELPRSLRRCVKAKDAC